MPIMDKLVDPRAARAAWISTLSKAPSDALREAWERLDRRPDFEELRAPETGMVMVRGRTGGGGDAFNLGELTATRCVARLASGETGVSYVMGRDKEHALIAAVVDAMMQSQEWGGIAHAQLVEPLQSLAKLARDTASRKAAATRVEFFTMETGRPGR